MKAICIANETDVELKELPAPTQNVDEHVLIEMEASAINPGDKYFLANPAARAMLASPQNVWGASGVGRVTAIAPGVPEKYLGKRVAIYRSLVRTPETVGLWCEMVRIHYLCCVILPEDVDAINYSGSLVNAITAFAFMAQATDDGHKGIIATAGNSATGLALNELARTKNIPVLSLVRTEERKAEMLSLGLQNVLATSESEFDNKLKTLAEKLNATAAFDGVGGELLVRILPSLPRGSTCYLYGMLGGRNPIKLESSAFIERGLTMRGFGNFMTKTVQDKTLLEKALTELSTVIKSPLFHTKPGKQFSLDKAKEALAYTSPDQAKAVLVHSK